jgi:hypothetical protein
VSVLDFGRGLLSTGDLDPVYLMHQRAALSLEMRRRWSFGYWLFYHAGVASRLAEADSFWTVAQQAQDEKWPRGTERRYFRGGQSQTALTELSRLYPDPARAVEWVAGPPGEPQTYYTVSKRAKTWRSFGEWIGFKVADMVDAVLETPVDFSVGDPEHMFFDAPRKGAAIVVAEHGLPGNTTNSHRAVTFLREHLGHHPAPHAPHRTVQVQEYETILCKYKSHLNGHYPLGHDTKHLKAALSNWGPLATELGTCL